LKPNCIEVVEASTNLKLSELVRTSDKIGSEATSCVELGILNGDVNLCKGRLYCEVVFDCESGLRFGYHNILIDYNVR
jgi:hypothetical protein